MAAGVPHLMKKDRNPNLYIRRLLLRREVSLGLLQVSNSSGTTRMMLKPWRENSRSKSKKRKKQYGREKQNWKRKSVHESKH